MRVDGNAIGSQRVKKEEWLLRLRKSEVDKKEEKGKLVVIDLRG